MMTPEIDFYQFFLGINGGELAVARSPYPPFNVFAFYLFLLTGSRREINSVLLFLFTVFCHRVA